MDPSGHSPKSRDERTATPESAVSQDSGASWGALPGRWHSAPLLVLTLIMGALCLLLARPFFSSLAWAVGLAVVLDPAYHRVKRRLRSANLAASITVVCLAVVVGLTAVGLLPGLVQAGLAGLEFVQQQLRSGAPAQLLERHPWIQSAWHWFETKADLAQAAQQAMASATSLGSSILQGSLVGVLEILLTLFFLFYFLRDQEVALQRLRSLLPLTSAETEEFLTWQVDTLYATLYGTVLLGVIQGTMGGLMFWWLGMNAPVFWGIIMGILCMLPVVGPSLVWGPAALLLALGGHWVKAILLVAWGSIIIGLIGNLLYPILLGRRLRLHTLAVFISMIGGLFLFGACGFFVGPVILAAMLSLLGIWKQRAIAASLQTTSGGLAGERTLPLDSL